MTDNTTEDKLITEAMAILDQEPLQARRPEEQKPKNQPTPLPSQTLASLDETRRSLKRLLLVKPSKLPKAKLRSDEGVDESA